METMFTMVVDRKIDLPLSPAGGNEVLCRIYLFLRIPILDTEFASRVHWELL